MNSYPQGPGYMPQYNGNSESYPPTPGFSTGYPPGNSNVGYPAQPTPGYPTSGYPAPHPTPGYPTAQSMPQPIPGFPSAPSIPHPIPGFSNTGYPAQPTPGYPAPQPGYPSGCQLASIAPSGFPMGYWAPPGLPYQVYPTAHCVTAVSAVFKPTVTPANPFKPRDDAAVLRKAMKGFGTDKKTIIQVLTRRSNEQRQSIAVEYRNTIGRDLLADLKSETSGKFEDLIMALMAPLSTFYAKELHDAMMGLGTKDNELIEILCTVSNREIHAIRDAYISLFGRSLEDDVCADTSRDFRKLLTTLCRGNRPEDNYVNMQQAKEDAQRLKNAGVGRLGTDEKTFILVLCSNSFAQLRALIQEYRTATGHDLEDDIKKEFSGDIERALRTIIKMVRNSSMFFAECLYKSMKGLGTHDRQLIRIMVTRCEVDLGDIAEIFMGKYGKTLSSFIEADTSGDYKKCLLSLLGGRY